MTYKERHQQTAKRIGKKLGITFKLDWYGGYCPIQAEGKVLKPNGVWECLYFRARGQHWSVSIDPRPHMIWHSNFNHKEPWPGDEFSAGWMTNKDAWACIEKALTEWKKNDRQRPTDNSGDGCSGDVQETVRPDAGT